MLLGDLSPGDRQKIMTICTIDVHARDVVANLISQKVSKYAGFRSAGFPVGHCMCFVGDNISGLCMAVPVASLLG